jgi:hypothetical protein
MELEKIQAEWEKDGVFNKEDPDPLSTDQLHNKYWRYLVLARQEMIPLESELNEIWEAKKAYFLKPCREVYDMTKWIPPKPPDGGKINKSNVDLYLNADKQIREMKLKQKHLELKIDFIEDVIKRIHNRSYLINAHIDWEKFKAGE